MTKDWKKYIDKYRWMKVTPELLELMPLLKEYDATEELTKNIEIDFEKLIDDIPDSYSAKDERGPTTVTFYELKQQLRKKWL